MATQTSDASTHNVDLAEIQKFSAAAHHWWDKNSEFKPLHDINPFRLAFIEEHAKGLASKRVLDVGCGGGILSEAMAAKGASVTGLDMGEASLEVARLHLLESGLHVDYVGEPVEHYASQHPAQFDVVTCMEMLEHVPDPASVIQACAQLVKPGGLVVFSTLNRNPKAYLQAVVGAEYLLQMLPRGTHLYEKFIKPSELMRWARGQGLEALAIKGVTYHPITQHYSTSNDVYVNYMLATQSVMLNTQNP